jgi:hypothetical protein
VALRIFVDDSGKGSSIHVVGRLEREGVPELEGVLSAAPAGAALDLSDLMSMDAYGAAALQRLRGSGVTVVGLHPGLAWKLLEDDR